MKYGKSWLRLALGALAILVLMCFARFGAAEEPKGGDAGPQVSRIEIKDFMFQPANVTVPAGTRITFVNRDEEPHTVASADGKFARSKPLDTDQEFTVTLSAAGEYAYFCTVHPHMTGKITVVAAAK